MMELENDHEEQKSFSMLQGDEFCISRVLDREALIGQSSRIFYRPAEGVPFKWETNPDTPKNPQEEGQIPPPSPSPLMQSLGLPLPNVDDHDHETKESALKRSIILSLRKMAKKNIISDISKKVEILGNWRSDKKKESSRFGYSKGEFVDLGFSSNSSFSTFSLDSRVVDTSTIDGPFCRNPLDIHTILDEGNTKIYYCSHHKTAFAVEEDNSFNSRILSRVSASDQFSGPLDNEQTPTGIPFRWEMIPGTPKKPLENELIPPPSSPPAVQSLALPRPRRQDSGEEPKDHSTSKNALFWRRKKKKTQNVKNGISFRCDEEFEASFRRAGSVSSLSSVASKARGSWRVVKIGRSFYGSYFSCSPWSRRDFFCFC